MSKRTRLDFSEHELHITKTDNIVIHYLKRPHTYYDSIKFINTQGILAITGDYGNWILCREFNPEKEKLGVSDGYWCEKLQIASSQVPYEFDSDAVVSQWEQSLKESDYTDDEIEFVNECIDRAKNHHEEEYTQYAYEHMPNNWDYDSIVFRKKPKYWLLVIFDAFEEICERVKKDLVV